jgi:oligosaccharyl transferase complex subunit OST4
LVSIDLTQFLTLTRPILPIVLEIPYVAFEKHYLSKNQTHDCFPQSVPKMISDDELYRLAIFLGSAAMLLIILYHILEVNAVEEPKSDSKTGSISQDSKANVVAR